MYCVFKDKELKVTGLSKELAKELADLIQGEVMTEVEAKFKLRRSLAHVPGLFRL